ncbi:MAG: hypothetical protein HY617_02550 [Candidatus Sungbacteria bacterium]|nr:hypothetical protein [Candidatus Sungbacteria bacterium]
MSRQTLIIVIIIVLGAAGLWFFFFQSSPDEAGTGEEQVFVSSNPDVQRIEQELSDLRRLKDLHIDTSILKNPFLQSLEPPRIPSATTGTSTATTRGRPNPFLPF